MSRRIIYFINPISGTKEKASLKQRIETATGKQGIPYEILPTQASGNYAFAEQKIVKEKVTDVVICGGDGTVNQVVRSFAHTGVQFGILPMGSGNGLALAANIPRNISKALDIVFNGTAQAIDAFKVNEEFACMLCGLGFDAKVAHEFAMQPKRGLRAYASVSTKNFWTAKPYPFRIEANGINFDTDAYFISIANSNQFGNNFTIAPRALLSDGLLDVVIVKKTAKPLLLINVIRQVVRGRLQKIENSLRSPVIYFQSREINIQNPASAPIHIDGEPRETTTYFNIRVLPAHFKLIHG